LQLLLSWRVDFEMFSVRGCVVRSLFSRRFLVLADEINNNSIVINKWSIKCVSIKVRKGGQRGSKVIA